MPRLSHSAKTLLDLVQRILALFFTARYLSFCRMRKRPAYTEELLGSCVPLTRSRLNAVKVHVVAEDVSVRDLLDFPQLDRTELDLGVAVFVKEPIGTLQTCKLTRYDRRMRWANGLSRQEKKILRCFLIKT